MIKDCSVVLDGTDNFATRYLINDACVKHNVNWIYGAAATGDPPEAIDFGGKIALVLGSEGKGIRRNVLEHCDRVVTIPMSGHVGSFNVATAAA